MIYVCLYVCVCVCVRVGENRHLEGHDKVCEVKLGLQVQLDRHVLHTWKTKKTPTTQEINYLNLSLLISPH